MSTAPMEELQKINDLLGDALVKLERALRILDEHAVWKCHVCGKPDCTAHEDANDERKAAQGE